MRRAAFAAGLAVTATVGMTSHASAHTAEDWGTVMTGAHCTQANSWALRAMGITGIADIRAFDSHYPAMAGAPNTSGEPTSINVPLLGNGAGVYTRAFGKRVPNPATGQPDVAVTCESHALAGAGAMDVGVPYTPPQCGVFPLQDCSGTQPSPIGFHLESIEQEATARPGVPVQFRGDIASGYISVTGTRVITLDPAWPANLGLRVPPSTALPAIAQVMANEQVTTTGKGVPTPLRQAENARKRYAYDPTAMSGYTNGLHVSLLGSTVGDLTLLHAAVLVDKLYLPAPICSYPAHRCAKPDRT